jgi:CheY-like chemotaxis protein
MELCKMSVLVVGHNHTTRRVLKLSLNLEGYGVHLAESPVEARRLIDEHWPQAIVIDVGGGSPELLALARDIRRSQAHRRMVIVASAPVRYGNQERAAYEAGCDAFVLEPDASRGLAQVLEAYLPAGTSLSAEAREQANLLRWN